ncbi:helicase-related protein [Dactylococcopsis salina]|uniref:DNA/RNA helicase, superfamily II, SNF2 family n=1 Tax=Dactylococcopsis salina (strain PCC 8305) TaxID=13035 RepID=K9YPW8_DACS8|nr:helicase-related protein [Dactylococcopsis salina]AFZ48924.1 DNA/RNA helicase, superfamily II, SNF2 family [Dactylococcopsis salina PCC 8305]
MTQLENLTRGATVRGVLPNQNVTVIDTQWHGSDVVELTYKDVNGQPHTELLLRDNETTLEIVTEGRSWSFDGDGGSFRLVSEAHRIRLAHLFDPLLAVHTSLVEPLPHQITAVYSEMLTRQPLRFLLADDPGAGKTIMAGLFIRELLIRGDLQRCLIVCPGSLAVQWQDELSQKFDLPFEILTNDRMEAARTGNALAEIPRAIARLDQLSRNDDLKAKLAQTDWDLVVVDEAHKMSASFFGGEIRETKRYKLGKLLSSLTRHFLLMTATPHNGKEEDFQLFLALLDSDRFEGKFRDGVHACDPSDLIRRLVKEDLLKFNGKPLFPERRAHTVQYQLSELESVLYQQVTDYVREEFNRAEALINDGRKGTVGFALTILQRRLASSPEAIYQSLKRRRERLQRRLQEEEVRKRGMSAELDFGTTINPEDWDDDFEDYSSQERENTEEEVVDQASAAQTIVELQAEIDQLSELENLALRVKQSGKDRKWEELSKLLQDRAEMFDAGGYRRKLVIFTEHRDTLNYLTQRIGTLLGRPEAVVTIHGGMGREERKKAEEAFKQDVNVDVLIATDAAGEGINLQRAHLMVNYDLPWNPNRLEQRFGRIHRIGQTEVCHLWNLVAEETREGDVYLKLLQKLEVEQTALGGKIFDVLGKAIAGKELRELLIEAIRYGDRADVKAKLNQAVTERVERERLQALLEERALARDSMDATKIQKIRESMERAEARKVQPYFIASFFLEAFQRLGGTIRQRESRRYEITHVPAVIRNRDQIIGMGSAIMRRYERICFQKELISVSGKPLAEFVCPGHPLLNATIDLILERHRDLLRQGAILIDENDFSETVRALVYLEHSIQDARPANDGGRRVVSRRMQYVEIDSDGKAQNAGYAPYLDYRPLTEEEQPLVESLVEGLALRDEIEKQASSYAISNLVPQHLKEVRDRKEELIEKTRRAVQDRLTKEINYWDQRAADLRLQEQAGKVNAKLNSSKAQQRADDLAARLEKRLYELEQERKLSPLPPVVVGGALVVPIGAMQRLQAKRDATPPKFARETQRVEQLAMEAVIKTETNLGYQPRDVSDQNCGYDIESLNPETGHLRFLEVKGRIEGADTVTVTKNEILTALNKEDNYILALVQVPTDENFSDRDAFAVREATGHYQVAGESCVVCYLEKPFQREPDWGASSVNYSWKEMWKRGTKI